MSESKLLLVDYNNLLYRSYFAFHSLTYQGRHTGGIYGFIVALAGYIKKIQPTNIVVCMDAKPYVRSKIYPEYKMDRKGVGDPADDDGIQFTRTVLPLVFKSLGIPVVIVPGLEADDIIGHLAKKYWDASGIFIASNDTDLLQLLEPNVVIYGTKDKVWSLKKFNEAYPDIKPYMWPIMTAMVGSHNGVPGIKGIGPKTALKLMTTMTLPDLMAHLKSLEEHEGDILRNIGLATVPLKKKYYPEMLDIELPPMDEYYAAGFLKLLKITGINQTVDMKLAFGG